MGVNGNSNNKSRKNTTDKSKLNPAAHDVHIDVLRHETIDVCNSTDLPEVEIISLLEEQLPHYKLRADTIYGYDHDDWLHTPLISPDVNLDLTTEQIEETLKYFPGSVAKDNSEKRKHTGESNDPRRILEKRRNKMRISISVTFPDTV
ncbi:Trafficking kinesin-binding protein 1 [Anabarilius grahami]|uniref:Trafficking kinesin-binding protein 1 n=1 Tax=Anabarilius grahami TaxID=495550 RepID=A0A3N0Y770_ANAGA|nr:Trafficking kinesin-binding protein 1 [Anabarilius grahami]